VYHFCTVFRSPDVEQGGGTSGEGPLKGGARSDSDEEYEVGSGNEGSEQEGYSSVEEGEPNCTFRLYSNPTVQIAW